jgi:cupin fold WbuC family metalloprotein
MLKIIDHTLLAKVQATAAGSARLRSNFNLHPTEDDRVQRFLNAIEPGSYVRPHRHVTPVPKWELFVALAGRLAVLLFDEQGQVLERLEISAEGPSLAVEIAAGAWHSIVALTPGTVVFEFKEGPYAPAADKDFAAWAPREGETGAAAMAQVFAVAAVGDCLAG